MDKVLISLFDYTGNASRPYRENGWKVIQVDIQHGIDILEWDYVRWYQQQEFYSTLPEVGIIAMIPCTDYALSGAKHFAAKDADGRTEYSQKLVAKTKEIIDFFDNMRVLKFWQIENPMSRIHTLNPWMGKPKMLFDPADYAGYDPIPDNSRYNKRTWIWGKFNVPEPKPLPALSKEYPGFMKYGGKSLKTKNARSVTHWDFVMPFTNLIIRGAVGKNLIQKEMQHTRHYEIHPSLAYSWYWWAWVGRVQGEQLAKRVGCKRERWQVRRRFARLLAACNSLHCQLPPMDECLCSWPIINN